MKCWVGNSQDWGGRGDPLPPGSQELLGLPGGGLLSAPEGEGDKTWVKGPSLAFRAAGCSGWFFSSWRGSPSSLPPPSFHPGAGAAPLACRLLRPRKPGEALLGGSPGERVSWRGAHMPWPLAGWPRACRLGAQRSVRPGLSSGARGAPPWAPGLGSVVALGWLLASQVGNSGQGRMRWPASGRCRWEDDGRVGWRVPGRELRESLLPSL